MRCADTLQRRMTLTAAAQRLRLARFVQPLCALATSTPAAPALAQPALQRSHYASTSAPAPPTPAASTVQSTSAAPVPILPREADSAATPSPSAAAPRGASIDKREVAKFGALAAEWWSPRGPFAALHALNAARVHFIRTAAVQHFGRDPAALRPLEGLRVLDVGCGGGILAEPLARLGGDMLGVDVTPENIGVARCHAAADAALAGASLAYDGVSAEALVERGDKYDLVIASEVIEHVRAPPGFVATLCALRAPRGAVAITTINRTPEAYALAIVAAEKLLGMAPDGAHDWNKFVRPEELQLMFGQAGLGMRLLAGMQLDVLDGRWRCTGHAGVNYAAFFAAEGEAADPAAAVWV